MIKKVGNKYVLYSKNGDRELGTYDTLKQAKEREGQVKFFKALNERNIKKG